MTEPLGRYRIQGQEGQPNMVLLEIGRIGVEVTEQEYRDRGYEPDFAALPWRDGACPSDENKAHEQQKD